jgi:hypothetical protein
MRAKPILFAVLSLLLLSAAFLVRAAGTNQPAAGPVLSMRAFELKPGVKSAVFEDFVRQQLPAALGPDAAGMKMRILKGDRGERKGAYLLVWQFDSVATRDRYFPREGGGSSQEFQGAWKQMLAALEKLRPYVKDPNGYTDYVEITE